MTTQQTRIATTTVRAFGSDLWHAGRLLSNGVMIIGCNGRAIGHGERKGVGVIEPTCKVCTKALAAGRIEVAS